MIIHFDLQYPELDHVDAKVVNHADSNSCKKSDSNSRIFGGFSPDLEVGL